MTYAMKPIEVIAAGRGFAVRYVEKKKGIIPGVRIVCN